MQIQKEIEGQQRQVSQGDILTPDQRQDDARCKPFPRAIGASNSINKDKKVIASKDVHSVVKDESILVADMTESILNRKI